MPCPMRTKASKRFSISGIIDNSVTIAFGASAAIMPGSVNPIKRGWSERCFRCPNIAPFMGPFIAPGPQPVQISNSLSPN